MNDATIVYPLPRSAGEMNQLLAPQDAGPGGALLPLKYWRRIPSINQGEHSTRTYGNLRLVAVRIDPCFKFRGDCLPQIRFVWQPIDKAVYGSASPHGLEAKDAAVHTFYTLQPDEFRRFVSDYQQLRSSMPMVAMDAPLQVHPLMQKQGLGGAFSRGFRQLLLNYCGEQNMWRVTSMSTLVGGDKWEFRGFNIVDGKPVEIVIPRTGNARAQSFFVSLVSDREYRNGRISPAPLGEDNLNLILRDSRAINARDADTLKDLGASVARIENPAIHSPETMDCVSCHSTQVAGTLLFGNVPWLSRDPQITRHAFRSSSPLLQSLATTRNIPRVFRALGYFEKTPILSRRVINETAVVVSQLNEGFSRQPAAAKQAVTDSSLLPAQTPSLSRTSGGEEHEKICHGEANPAVRGL
ncbi:MAG: hypothetical protein MUE59_01120 [Thiobacillaceae bacterium]|nr:hypothetical protein [Thiobacillaceae bacterium]